MSLVLAALLASALIGEEPTPAPTPTPAPPVLVASLESTQDEGGERTALFDDGTLVHTITLRSRSTTQRKIITTNERDVIAHIASEALKVEGDGDFRSPALASQEAPRFRLEILDAAGKPRTFLFDVLSQLPLALGRVRGAVEDLRSRFYKKPDPKDFVWDPARVKTDDLLKRRADGKWFRVVRDDNFEKNIEFVELGEHASRFFLTRDEIPKVFEDPEDARGPSE